MRAAAQLALALLLFSPCATAQNGNNRKPAVVSAEALEYGVALAEHADDELLAWAGEFVESRLRWHSPDLKATVAAVDKTFSSHDADTRDLVVYLVVYLAYEDQRELEDSFARLVKQYKDQTAQIRADLDRWQRYGVPPPSIAARPTATVNRSREIERIYARLRELETRSRMRGTQLREIRGRVNFYLKALNAVYPRFEDVAPEGLDSVEQDSGPSS